MSAEDFEAHLGHPAPAFRCYACGDRSENPTFLARVSHRLNPPADARALATIDGLLGPLATVLQQFYARHDGLLMYEDLLPSRWSGGEFNAAGISFFAVGDWDEKSREMRESLAEMGWPEEDFTDWLMHGIAFGEMCHSANYLVIQPTGEDAGKVFYAVHESFEEDPIAESFETLLDTIVANPADFLNRLGCHTRYSDGKTDIQWIPKEYVAG
jgi:hypothetical protein